MKTTINMMFFIFVCSASFAVAAVDYNQPLTPDATTVGLWHFNTIDRPDANTNSIANDPFDPARALFIAETYVDATPAGVLISAPTAALSQAVYISGPDVVGWENFQTEVWSSAYDTVKIEAWVKMDNIIGATRNLIEADSWRVQRLFNSANNSVQLGLEVNFSDGTRGQVWTSNIANNNLDGKWLHITAAFDQSKHMSFDVFSQDRTYVQTVAADFPGKYMEMGGTMVYMGWRIPLALDEVRISATDYTQIPAPAWLSLNRYSDTGNGTYGLWHFDSAVSGISPDDDSVTARNFDMQLHGTAAIDSAEPKFSSNLVINGYGDFAECVAAFPYGLPLTKFSAEAWFKVDPSIIYSGDGMYYIITQDPTFLLTLEVYYNEDLGNTELYADFRVNSAQGFKQVESLLANDGNWHHVAGAFDHGTVKIFVDGIQKKSGLLPGGAVAASAPMSNYFIGADAAGQESFYGRIDEVRMSAFNLICGDLGYLAADFDHNCVVNFEDFAEISAQWMMNTLH